MDAPSSAWLDAGVGFLVFGTRRLGTIEELDGTRVETSFTHLNFMPFSPQESVLVLGSGREYVIPFHARSIRTGYLRTWPVVGTAGLAACAVLVDSAPVTIPLAVAAVGCLAVWIGAMRYDGLSDDERARRRVFRAVTGYSADPRLLVHPNPSLRAHLLLDVERRAERVAPDGYREGLKQWNELAARGSAVDAPFLAAALTLARIDGDAATESAIWQRLSTRVTEVPERIAPIVSLKPDEESPAAEAAPSVADWRPPVDLPTTRGAFVERGSDVSIARAAWAPPAMCASCLAPAETTRRSIHGWMAAKTHVDVPYCQACAAHAMRESTRHGAVQLVAAGLGSVAAAAAVVVAWSLPLAIVVAVLACVAITFATLAAFPARRAAPPASIAFDAARLVAADDASLTLFCANDEWARRAAEHFGGTRVERKRVDPRVFTIAGIASFAAAGVAGAMWHFSNPTVRVDNGTGAPVDVWVDGRVVATVGPTTGIGLEELRVYRGVRRIGWSKAGAGAPASETTMRFTFGHGNYLLDPGARHCYWVDATVYGNTRADESQLGARTISELYDMSKIDDWFVAAPNTDRVEGGGGKVRYQLSRAKVCTEVEASCPKGTRESYWNCLVGVTEAGAARCVEAMRKSCRGDD